MCKCRQSLLVFDSPNGRTGVATQLNANDAIDQFIANVITPVALQVYAQFPAASWAVPGGAVPASPMPMMLPAMSIGAPPAVPPNAGAIWLIAWSDGSYTMNSTLAGFDVYNAE